MKNFITLSFLLLCACLAGGLFAQEKGKVVFEKAKHDFGQIKEEDGLAEVTFNFTNTGTAPLTLTDVKASCGCTTPTWTREAVAPGKTGIVKAAYNPQNRPGPFTKSITVNTDGDPAVVILTIAGDVVPRERGPKDWYPQEIGSLRVRSRSVYIAKALHDQVTTSELLLFNQGNTPVNVLLEQTRAALPAYLSIEAPEILVNPQDSVILKINFDAPKRNDWGYVSDRFVLMTDDAKEPAKQFYVSANIVENFGTLKADAKIPMVKFDKTTHNFGTIQEGSQNTVSFTLTNAGDGLLIIRKTKASCGCTVGQPKKNTLAPGESTIIEVSFNSTGKNGKQNQTVNVITNDPANADTRLTIVAEVQPKANGSQK
ncbi:MAG: hypothetical protein OHK0053_20850 [Microscillaceae bacterium]